MAKRFQWTPYLDIVVGCLVLLVLILLRSMNPVGADEEVKALAERPAGVDVFSWRSGLVVLAVAIAALSPVLVHRNFPLTLVPSSWGAALDIGLIMTTGIWLFPAMYLATAVGISGWSQLDVSLVTMVSLMASGFLIGLVSLGFSWMVRTIICWCRGTFGAPVNSYHDN